MDLEGAQKAVEEGSTLERVLKEKMAQLEDDNKDLMVYSMSLSSLNEPYIPT